MRDCSGRLAVGALCIADAGSDTIRKLVYQP